MDISKAVRGDSGWLVRAGARLGDGVEEVDGVEETDEDEEMEEMEETEEADMMTHYCVGGRAYVPYM